MNGDGLIMDFLEAPLALIGMRPSEQGGCDLGVLFEGDGIRSAGTYHAWASEDGRVVSIANYRVLKDLPYSVTFPRFVAIRHDMTRFPGRNELMVFVGSGKQPSTARLGKGLRCNFVEVEYLADYLSQFHELGSPADIAQSFLELGAAITWSAQMMVPFEAIERCERSGAAASLVLSGATELLFGSLLAMRVCATLGQEDRQSIAEVVRYVDVNLDKPLRQAGLLALAGMSAAKFKRTFKAHTGSSMREYIFNRRIEKAKSLLARGEAVSAVAAQVGLGSPMNFATAFKRATGQSPTQWRKASRIRPLPPTTLTVQQVYPENEPCDGR